MRWIVTDNIYGETWRQLLEYSNIEFSIAQIEGKHGKASDSSLRSNYAKQAAQARLCVLQAKEYFDAARSSSLFTSPNHAYYGSVALASLTLLMLGNGSKSLDVLRQDKKNNHHGLDFKCACTAKNSAKGFELLSNCTAQILKFGHFASWYQVLPALGEVHATIHQQKILTNLTSYGSAGMYAVPRIETLVSSKRSLMDLVKFLPDLDSDLQRFQANTVRSKSNHDVYHNGGTEKHTWRLHACGTPEERDQLLERFIVDSRYIDNITCTGIEDGPGAIVTVTQETADRFHFEWPTARDTLNHDTISYAQAPDVHEIVDLYLVAYQLSMLARYFPDIWISCIESQCRGAKLIERAVEIIVKKLPILTLSLISSEQTVISTHREPWRS